MRDVAAVIPSVGAAALPHCLEAVDRLDPRPHRLVLVLSGGAPAPSLPPHTELITSPRRLGFTAAVNRGLEAAGDAAAVALLNDDALPEPAWLAPLLDALEHGPELAAVQGTVLDAAGTTVDGRGIALDRFGLPVQRERGAPAEDEPAARRLVLGVSGTAALLRGSALAQAALPGGAVLDPRLDCYHEDLDLALRLHRLGWAAAWVPGARCRHLGSVSGRRLSWRHPWWILANRWRVLAGNLTHRGLHRLLPRLLRGELRAVRTLARGNPRAPAVGAAVLAQLPRLIAWGLRRPSPGARLERLPEPPG